MLTPLTELVVICNECLLEHFVISEWESSSTVRNAILNIQVTLVLVRLWSVCLEMTVVLSSAVQTPCESVSGNESRQATGPLTWRQTQSLCRIPCLIKTDRPQAMRWTPCYESHTWRNGSCSYKWTRIYVNDQGLEEWWHNSAGNKRVMDGVTLYIEKQHVEQSIQSSVMFSFCCAHKIHLIRCSWKLPCQQPEYVFFLQILCLDDNIDM